MKRGFKQINVKLEGISPLILNNGLSALGKEDDRKLPKHILKSLEKNDIKSVNDLGNSLILLNKNPNLLMSCKK